MSGLSVINHERMERLKPHPFTTIPFNLNTLSVIVLVICMIVIYRRYMKVKKSREQRHT